MGNSGTPEAPTEPSEPTPGLPSTGPESRTSGGRGFRLRILEGSQAGQTFESEGNRIQLGSHPLNQVRLKEPTLSRFHCELSVDDNGRVWIRDLQSRNGTRVEGVRVREAEVPDGALLELGRARLRLEIIREPRVAALPEATGFGSLVGHSHLARASFALLERAAASDITVLLEGETGTGKSQAAEAIHAYGARQAKPFRVVDCGAVPEHLLESELFGHERGAFTGATDRRIGVFEEAQGGTVFLDEVGEIPIELQPKLLRVLEARQVRRVGSNAYQTVDVRVVAATNRDLRSEVNAGRFRPDLYFRLAVFRIGLPPLRERPEDVPLVAERLLDAMALNAETERKLRAPAFLARLRKGLWPGNARELRNHLERCAVLEESLHPPSEEAPRWSENPDVNLPYPEARRRVLEAFERAFVVALLDRHEGNVSRAALAARLDRVHLHRLIRRHQLKPATGRTTERLPE